MEAAVAESLTEEHITQFMRTYFKMRCDVLLGDIHILRVASNHLTVDQEQYYQEALSNYDEWFSSLITKRIMNYPQVNPLLAKEEVERYFLDALGISQFVGKGGSHEEEVLRSLKTVVNEVAPIVVSALSPENDPYFYFQKLIGIVSRIASGTKHPFTEFVTTQCLYDVAIRNFMKYKEFLSEHERCMNLFFDSVRLSSALSDLSNKIAAAPAYGLRAHSGFIGDLMFVNTYCGFARGREIARQSIWRATVRIYSSGSVDTLVS